MVQPSLSYWRAAFCPGHLLRVQVASKAAAEAAAKAIDAVKRGRASKLTQLRVFIFFFKLF